MKQKEPGIVFICRKGKDTKDGFESDALLNAHGFKRRHVLEIITTSFQLTPDDLMYMTLTAVGERIKSR